MSSHISSKIHTPVLLDALTERSVDLHPLCTQRRQLIPRGGGEGMYGGEFTWHGIPKGSQGLIFSPEYAVEMASRVTGARASDVPRYFRRGVGFGPSVGYWKVSLERTVEVTPQDGSAPIRTNIIYVDGRLNQVAAPQPGLRPAAVMRFAEGNAPRRVSREIEVQWRNGFSSEVVPIRIPKEEGEQ